MTEITQEDLLRFFYGETSETKTAAVKAALQKDFHLRESYNQLRSLQQALDLEKITPSDEVVDKIMKYAASKQPRVETH